MACEGIACFYITGHGIDESLMKRVMKCGRDFFNLPMDKKVCISLKKSTAYRGYVQQGDELNPVLWLAAWASKILRVRDDPLNNVLFPSVIDQALDQDGWTLAKFLFCVSMDRNGISVHMYAKNNEANIHPSWPHAWSILTICNYHFTCTLASVVYCITFTCTYGYSPYFKAPKRQQAKLMSKKEFTSAQNHTQRSRMHWHTSPWWELINSRMKKSSLDLQQPSKPT